ncbi:MAG: hypothetical protein AB7O98_01525 [Hyphomonadaceae bacterium]
MHKLGLALAGAIAGAAFAAIASAQPMHSRLGWLNELSGQCFEGRDAAGAVVDRQCFQRQFSVLRSAITRSGGFQGESVLGWSRERGRLELYAWSNRAAPAVYLPGFGIDGEMLLAGANRDERILWRRTEDGFQVVDQTRSGGAWTDASVITYARAGAAPAVFSAQGVTGAAPPDATFGWLTTLSGQCFRQVEPTETATRGCFAMQYPGALRQTWYWGGGQASGESLMFVEDGAIRFFHWDAQGNFGIGHSVWDNRRLLSTTDSSGTRRTVMERSSASISLTTQTRENRVGEAWGVEREYRFRRV